MALTLTLFSLIPVLLAGPQITSGTLIFTHLFPPKIVSVSLRVDFGPARASVLEKEVRVREGATPKEALRQMLPFTEGEVCCHPAEVKGIDGVMSDPEAKRWWRLKINGDSVRASPYRSRLKAGDSVEWVYFEDTR
jgi:hypothetical protein